MSALRIAVFGAGRWGRNHVRAVAGLAEADLLAVCDPDPARQDEVSRQYPGTVVTSDAAAALDGAEAVVVASPAATHVELAELAIKRGLPVLIEKPMALSGDAARRVADAARANDVQVLVGHLLLFHPAVEQLREMVQSQELGDIFYLYSQRVNLGEVRPDESALWSFGPHDVSVALYLLGEAPVSVAAHGRSYLQPGIEDVVFLILEFASGIMAHVQMSWLDPHKSRRLTVVGSRRMVIFDDMEPREKLKVFDKGIDRPPDYGSYGESLSVREGDIFIPRVPNVEPLTEELRHFVAVARGEIAPRADVQSGLDVVDVLEAATESLRREGQVVRLASLTNT